MHTPQLLLALLLAAASPISGQSSPGSFQPCKNGTTSVPYTDPSSGTQQTANFQTFCQQGFRQSAVKNYQLLGSNIATFRQCAQTCGESDGENELGPCCAAEFYIKGQECIVYVARNANASCPKNPSKLASTGKVAGQNVAVRLPG